MARYQCECGKTKSQGMGTALCLACDTGTEYPVPVSEAAMAAREENYQLMTLANDKATLKRMCNKYSGVTLTANRIIKSIDEEMEEVRTKQASRIAEREDGNGQAEATTEDQRREPAH